MTTKLITRRNAIIAGAAAVGGLLLLPRRSIQLPPTYGHLSLQGWRARGQDKNSLISDPLFVDPKRYNFRLRSNSPALKLGFKPIDTSTVGPRPRR